MSQGKKDDKKPGTLIVMRESQVHQGIQHGLCGRSLSPCSTVHYRGFEGSQLAIQAEMHAKQFSCGAQCQQHDDD